MTTTSPPTTPQPRRRWFQYTLRTFMLFVLVAGIGMGWFVPRMQSARGQRDAVAVIRTFGGASHRTANGLLQDAATW